MLERPTGGFFGGLWVFPGGAVDPVDGSDLAARAVIMPEGGDDLPGRAAALRETGEEVGLLLTDQGSQGPVDLTGEEVFEHALSQGLRLDGRRLRLLSQWVTPRAAPKRFDTRFYLTVVSGDQPLQLRAGEVEDVAWVGAREALEDAENGKRRMITPTLHHLQWLTRYSAVEAAWEAAGRATVVRVEPLIERDGSEVRVTLPEAAELP